MDGTIQDSERLATEANRHGFRIVLGCEATPEELDFLVGKPALATLNSMFPGQGDLILEHGVEFYLARSHSITGYSGIVELLEQLREAGFRLGIVSSKHRRFIVPELESKSLLQFFECIVGQEDTVKHKPDPEPLLLASSVMGVRPEECVYIGDQPTDVLAARGAGMVSAGALWGEGKLEKLAPVDPDLMFKEPVEVIEFFVSRNLTA
ncbi:HAD family hydrolase [Paenibacillus piri]|uniref:HAD family hydrolase n=2 Tax=Paenibacillus piri TaxID=2547395 RepID=A0A4R5KCJ7_9BACL|nr:HAD family hydrolase [Paenibacillus piri]